MQRLLISNLPKENFDMNLIKYEFQRFGEITEYHVSKDPKTGQFRGAGHVTYLRSEAAVQAFYNLNGKKFGSKMMVIKFPCYNDVETLAADVYLRPVPNEMSDDNIVTLFSRYGSLLSVKTFREKEIAFVRFRNVDEARVAVRNLNGAYLYEYGKKTQLIVRFSENSYHITYPKCIITQEMKDSGVTLFVWNLPDYFEEFALYRMFALYGAIYSAKVKRHYITMNSKHYGVVIMGSKEQAIRAQRALDGLRVGIRNIAVYVDRAALEA